MPLRLIDSLYDKEDHLAVSDIYLKSRRYGIIDHMGYTRLFNVAESLRYVGITDRSRHILEELSQSYSEGYRHRKILLALAEIDYSEGAYGTAKERVAPIFERETDLSDRVVFAAKELLGRVFLREGEFQESARCYAGIVGFGGTSGNNAMYHKRFADALMGMNLFGSAIARYNLAIALAEKSGGELASAVIAESCEKIAMCYYETGKFAESAKMFGKFLEHSSGVTNGRHLWALYRMGMGHAKLSDPLMTEQIFASLIEKGNDPFWEQVTKFSVDFEKWRIQYGDYVSSE